MLGTRQHSHLTLVVNNDVVASGFSRRKASSSSDTSAAPARSPVRLARTAESSELADNLVDAYHRERQVTPHRSVIRVEVGELVSRGNLELAVSELESRGWSVNFVGLDNDIKSAQALWLRPYC
jgi:hypothetical protein